MPLTNRLYRLLAACTLITFSVFSGRIAASSEPDPQWLPAYQQIIYSKPSVDAVQLMENFLYTYQEDEGACEALAVPYLLQVGTQIAPHIEVLNHESSNPVIQGLILFACTFKEEQQLLYERASLNSVQQLWETLKYVWLQQDRQALLFEQALEQMNALKKQRPDSLSLTWFTAELHRLKPGGGHWQAERIWENWVTANPDRNTARTNIYRKTPYTRTGLPTKATEEWSFPGLKGAAAFAERPVRITAGGGGSVYLPAQQQAQHRHSFHTFAVHSSKPHRGSNGQAGFGARSATAGSDAAAFAGITFSDDESKNTFNQLNSDDQYQILRSIYQNKDAHEHYCDQDGCAHLLAMGPGGAITAAVAATFLKKVVQTGGRKIFPRTAEILNKNLGRNLHHREWGRALEELKSRSGLRKDHHGKIYGNGDYYGPKSSRVDEYIGNIDDWLP